MYFLIKDLAALNHMYCFSLGVFLSLFRTALMQARVLGFWFRRYAGEGVRV